jgi:hypothetical protein
MERRGGVVDIRAFGGNRLLGGYNFDRELARWLLVRLQERGVQITIDDTQPEGRGKWARLLHLAERTKIALAKAPTAKMPVRIREQAIFDDDNGRSVSLIDQITREQFVPLIHDMLEETIYGPGGEGQTKGCNQTLAEAKLRIEEIDEILLVGGSTYAPWVADTIRNAWGREAQLFEPDLCVAAGAAIRVTALPEEVRGARCRVDLVVPKQTALESISIGGKVLPIGDEPVPAGLRAMLATPQGRHLSSDVRANGDFLFGDVELLFEGTSKFELTVTDREARKVLEHRFEVTYAPEGKSDTVGVLTVLPKPLYIEVLGGLTPLAEEGAPLPAHCEVDLTRTNADDIIEIRLFQEADLIGSVAIRNVPDSAPIGAKVRLVVDVSRNNRITGRATAFTRLGGVAAEAPVDIGIRPLEIPTLSVLREQFQQLEAERVERIDFERNAETRMVMRARGDKVARKIKREIEAKPPDLAQIWFQLRELRSIAHPPKEEMQPPPDQFEGLLMRLKEIMAAKTDDPQVQSQRKVVDRLESEGRAALARKDVRSWSQVNVAAENLLRRFERPAREEPDRELPSTVLLKLFARMQLDQTRQLLRAEESKLMQDDKLDRFKGRINRVRENTDRVEAEIEQIDENLPPRAAQGQLQLIYFQRIKPIEEEIKTLGYDVRKG